MAREGDLPICLFTSLVPAPLVRGFVPRCRPTTVYTGVRHGVALFPQPPAAASGSGPVICEINTTPLIDVLLVLLVTLILTLRTRPVRL